MARPLSTPDFRGGSNGRPSPTQEIGIGDHAPPDPSKRAKSRPDFVLDQLQENDRLRTENSELRALCYELEQALHESSQHNDGSEATRLHEVEASLDEKTEAIRVLHLQLQETQTALQDVEAQAAQAIEAAQANQRVNSPVPREAELLGLSEDLERERRQLQEDEQSLMEQMREMEVGMAKERAEMARQRNDLQRLQGEIRHELERLEKNGAVQSKIDGLKTKLQDATTRRGAARGAAVSPSAQMVNQTPAAAETPESGRKDSFMGRLFGGKK